MKRRNILFYIVISMSVGYLIYNSFISDYRFGMMGHHYGYYEGYTANSFYWNTFLVFLAYLLILFSVSYLVINNRKQGDSITSILDHRLSTGEITVDEYKKIKQVLSESERR